MPTLGDGGGVTPFESHIWGGEWEEDSSPKLKQDAIISPCKSSQVYSFIYLFFILFVLKASLIFPFSDLLSEPKNSMSPVYCLLLVLEQRAGMLTAHKIPEIPNLRVLSTSKAHYVNRPSGPFCVPCGN